jgi:hypothetical protein
MNHWPTTILVAPRGNFAALRFVFFSSDNDRRLCVRMAREKTLIGARCACVNDFFSLFGKNCACKDFGIG